MSTTERDAAERRRRADATPVDRVGLRDYFAGQALAGLLACPTTKGDEFYFAKEAYLYADAMVDERDRDRRIE